MSGERFDSSNEPAKDGAGKPAARQGRPFVGVQFNCCGVYARIYLNRAETSFVGHCPRCGRRVELKVEAGGSDSRFFTAF